MAFFCISCRSNIDPNYKACPFCGEPVTDFLRSYLEKPIDGKYQILSRLGIGGMGEVYKVLHVHLNSVRVIKMMRANMITEEGAHERFVREARLATRIHHPNVATLFDFSTLPDGSYYMVWEFIEGTNLNELLRARRGLSPRYVAQTAVQALTGLEAIHRIGIVHRDISPENLMVTRDEEGQERIKIIDLGIAKQWGDASDDKTKTGMFVGKWKYCSPEHLGMLKQGERIDGRADIYSFGIVIYELLSGAPPFLADSPHGYLMLHAKEAPKPLGLESAELEAVVLRALEKDREKRFATAKEMARALEAIIPSLPEVPIPAVPIGSSEATTEQRAAPTLRTEVRGSDDKTVPSSTLEAAPYITRPQYDTTEKVAELPGGETTELAATLVVQLKKRKPLVWGGAIAASLAVLLLMIALIKREPAAATPRGTVTASLAPAAAPARLGINAFPWAEVVGVKNVQTAEAVSLPQQLVTPAALDLPPGRYELILKNPQFDQPQSQVIELSAGEQKTVMVQFSPRPTTLPRFEGKSQ